MSTTRSRGQRSASFARSVGDFLRLSRKYEHFGSEDPSPVSKSDEVLLKQKISMTASCKVDTPGSDVGGVGRISSATYKVMLSSASVTKSLQCQPSAGSNNSTINSASKLKKLRSKVFGVAKGSDNPLYEQQSTDSAGKASGTILSVCSPVVRVAQPFGQKLHTGCSQLHGRSGSLQIAALRSASGTDLAIAAGLSSDGRDGSSSEAVGAELLRAVRDLCSVRDQLQELAADQHGLKEQVSNCTKAIAAVQQHLASRSPRAGGSGSAADIFGSSSGGSPDQLAVAKEQLTGLRRDLELAKQIVRQQDGQVEAMAGRLESKDAHIEALHRQIEKMEVWALGLQEEYDLARCELDMHLEADAARMAAEEDALLRMIELDRKVMASMASGEVPAVVPLVSGEWACKQEMAGADGTTIAADTTHTGTTPLGTWAFDPSPSPDAPAHYGVAGTGGFEAAQRRLNPLRLQQMYGEWEQQHSEEDEALEQEASSSSDDASDSPAVAAALEEMEEREALLQMVEKDEEEQQRWSEGAAEPGSAPRLGAQSRLGSVGLNALQQELDLLTRMQMELMATIGAKEGLTPGTGAT